MDEVHHFYGKYLSQELVLQETKEGLEVTADVGDQETTVVLELSAIKRLRLTLQKYERQARLKEGG